jgi:hypothetical protein
MKQLGRTNRYVQYRMKHLDRRRDNFSGVNDEAPIDRRMANHGK